MNGYKAILALVSVTLFQIRKPETSSYYLADVLYK